MALRFKILLVCQPADGIDTMKDLLNGADYAFAAAPSGREGLEKAFSWLPDLILLDFGLSDMSGQELVRQIRGRPETAALTIVGIAAPTDREARLDALEYGIDGFVDKPIDASMFKAHIGSLAKQKRRRDRCQADFQALQAEKAHYENLLFNVLPTTVVNQLKAKEGIIAEDYADATVLFADIVGFTAFADGLPVVRLVTMLNDIFSAFDELVEQHGLEKIKTIGDAYMVVGGIPEARGDHAEAVAALALDLLREIDHHQGPHGQSLAIRIGINTGPVMAGVIGVKKFVFDLWGDTVNTASRMESLGLPGNIQVSEASYQRLCHRFAFEKRGVLHVKGKGEMLTYFLLGEKGEQRTDRILEAIKRKGEASYGLERAGQELETLALHDDLTGLHSRNGFLALARHQMTMAAREGRRVLVLLVRLDNLEHINATLGHQSGETALKDLADLLYRTFRISDLVGRIGGNLFLVFGLEVTLVHHRIMQQRLVQKLSSHITTIEPAMRPAVSVSTQAWDPKDAVPLTRLLSRMEKTLNPVVRQQAR